MENGKKQYTLSAIIPCWNCAGEIGELMDCLLKQSFTDWIAICVDDGCTDSTANVILDYARRDSRIVYHKRERLPKGAQTCRNIGMDLSEGSEYVVFLDADDLIAPYCFEQRIRFMQEHPSVDFASFPMKAFKTDIYDDTFWGFGIPGSQELLPSLLYWKTIQIVVPSNIYRRDSLVGAGIRWDERVRSMQDAEFNIQSLTKGLQHSFSERDRIDYYYRQGQATVSKRIADPSMFESHLYLIGKVTRSIQDAFQNRYDFNLEAYIVNFFTLFRQHKEPYRELLKLGFVKGHPAFRFRIVLFLLLGMRGNTILFKRFINYSTNSAKQWAEILSRVLRAKIEIETSNG